MFKISAKEKCHQQKDMEVMFMKHVSKALLLVLVLILTVAVFASCSSVNGLTKESEALGSPEKVARNKTKFDIFLNAKRANFSEHLKHFILSVFR